VHFASLTLTQHVARVLPPTCILHSTPVGLNQGESLADLFAGLLDCACCQLMLLIAGVYW
jgi:hypothetical protein